MTNPPIQTMIDYPEKIAFEVFTPGCNYRCPTCHSAELLNSSWIEFDEQMFRTLKRYVEINRGWVEGFVISGGEPTLQKDLIEFAERIKKETGLLIKLDTNGSNPDAVKRGIEKGVFDYVALDVKAPLKLYPQVTGVGINPEILRDSWRVLSGLDSDKYEFRTTVVPLIDSEVRWMNKKDAKNMAEEVYEVVGHGRSNWYVQPFVSREKGEMLDDRFSKEELPQEFHKTPENILVEYRNAIKAYFPNSRMR